MECNRWEEEGLLFTSDELSATQAAQYKAHLSECPECKREYDEYNDLVINVIGENYPLAELSNEADARIKASIEEAALKKPKGRYILGISFTTLLRRSAVALVVVALSYFATINIGGNTPVESNQIAGTESTIVIADSAVNDSLKKFREGDAEGIKSVNVREE